MATQATPTMTTARDQAAARQLRTVRRPPLADCPDAWHRVIPLDLAGAMRDHGVSIRELAARTGLTMALVRRLRSRVEFTWNDALGLYEAIALTGDFEHLRSA